MEFYESKTAKNLMTAFAGESQARNKYSFFAKEAEKAGYVHLAKVYEETAENEREHAKIWYKQFHDGDISDTLENLKECIDTENYESTSMYPTFAQEAEEEGYKEIAETFRHVAEIENMHKERFEALYKEIEEKTAFKKDYPIEWECSKCGHISNSKEAPHKCPVCGHPQGYFFEHCENY